MEELTNPLGSRDNSCLFSGIASAVLSIGFLVFFPSTAIAVKRRKMASTNLILRTTEQPDEGRDFIVFYILQVVLCVTKLS